MTTNTATPAANTAAQAPQGLRINGIVFGNDHPLVKALDAARQQGIVETLKAVDDLEAEAAVQNKVVDARMHKTAASLAASLATAVAAEAPSKETANVETTAAKEEPAKGEAAEAKKDEKKSFPWGKAAAIVGGSVVVGGAGYFAYRKFAESKAAKAASATAALTMPTDMAVLEVGYTPTSISNS